MESLADYTALLPASGDPGHRDPFEVDPVKAAIGSGWINLLNSHGSARLI